jgi:hypothetical protein
MILYVIRIITHEEGYWLKAIQIYLLSSIAVLLASSYQVFNVLKENLYGTILPFPSIQLLERYGELENWEYFGAVTDGSIRVSSTFADPNTLAAYCASLIPFAMIMVLIYKSNIFIWKGSFTNLIILLGLVAMVIATVSKAGFLSMLVGIFLTLKFTFSKLSGKQRRWAGIVLTLMFISFILYGIHNIALIQQRLSSGDSGHIEYRLTAWNIYISGSWLRGEGFGQYLYGSAHTIVLTALLELGVFGSLLVFIITIHPLSYLKYLKSLSSIMASDVRIKYYYSFMSSSVASFCGILLGLYLYDYWMHPFTWISISFFLSIVSHIEYGLRNGNFKTL